MFTQHMSSSLLLTIKGTLSYQFFMPGLWSVRFGLSVVVDKSSWYCKQKKLRMLGLISQQVNAVWEWKAELHLWTHRHCF